MLFTVLSYAQVGINNTTADQSAALDVTSTTRGLLVPRMTMAQRNDIKDAALGLMVFCTNCASGEGELQIKYETGWKNAADAIAPVITVNPGIDTVEQGSNWTDAGATSDGVEEVTAQGTVNTNTPDTYTITYTATDAAGNVGTATRLVTVEPVADFEIGNESNYNTETNIITIQLSNIGSKKSTGALFEEDVSDFRRIFEVTTNINDSRRIGNLQARTPLYVTKNGVSTTYYPKSQPDFDTNSIIDIEITSNNETLYSAISPSIQPPNDDVPPLYITTTPTQEPGDIQTISFKITDDFEPGKTYIFCADDVAWYSNREGDTVEIIDDLDNPSNNYFVWTVPRLTIPIILIKWNDLDFDSSQLSFNGTVRPGTFSDVDDLLNKEDYNYPKNNPEDPSSGSVVDYYKAISHGRMIPNFEIINASSNDTPTSLDDYAYNIDGSYANYGEENDRSANLLKPQLLAAYNQAVTHYGIENFNKLYGKNKVCFIHSGYGAETFVDNRFDYIWSHKWDFINGDNEKIKYFINPYKKENNNITNIIPIGVIVKESMHTFGLPNFYDTDFTSKGAGYLSMMGSGSWGVNSQSPWLPAFATPYTRNKLSRYFTSNIIEINDTAANLSLPPISTTDKSYKLTIPGNTNEYWLLEYKTRVGFDRHLPSDGIVIWHVVESVNNNNNEIPSNNRGESGYKMSLEASDGLFNLERKITTNSRGLWGTGQEFSPYSSPSTVMQNGNSTGIRVYNIRQAGDDMLFDVEYITEPDAKINTVTLDNDILTITTTELVGESLEIGFNNNDYVSFYVSSPTMQINLNEEPYQTHYNEHIKVRSITTPKSNGFNTLNIRAAANSFTNDRSERPFSYNYTFYFTESGRPAKIKPGAKIINQNEDKLIKFKY